MSLGAVAVIALSGNAAAQPDAKAADVLAGTRKAIGGKKLDSLTSLSLRRPPNATSATFK